MNEERRGKLYAALKTLRGRRAAEIDEQVAEFIRSAEADRKHVTTTKHEPTANPKRRQKKQKQQKQYTVLWTNFDGGRDASIPLHEQIMQRWREFHGMAASDDPVLRVQGRKLIEQDARAFAAMIGGETIRVGAQLPKARVGAKKKRRSKGDETKRRVLELCRELERRREPKHKWAKTVCDRLGISRPTFYRHAPDWAKKKRSLTSDSVVKQKGGRRTSRK